MQLVVASVGRSLILMGWRLNHLAPTLQAMALLTQEESPRVQALDGRALGHLLCVLREPPTSDSLLAALGAVTHLAEAYPTHRSALLAVNKELQC